MVGNNYTIVGFFNVETIKNEGGVFFAELLKLLVVLSLVVHNSKIIIAQM